MLGFDFEGIRYMVVLSRLRPPLSSNRREQKRHRQRHLDLLLLVSDSPSTAWFGQGLPDFHFGSLLTKNKPKRGYLHLLVFLMYSNGYGIPKDTQKVFLILFWSLVIKDHVFGCIGKDRKKKKPHVEVYSGISESKTEAGKWSLCHPREYCGSLLYLYETGDHLRVHCKNLSEFVEDAERLVRLNNYEFQNTPQQEIDENLEFRALLTGFAWKSYTIYQWLNSTCSAYYVQKMSYQLVPTISFYKI
ncbi:unnamed protein product [Lactuca saligna]|uniref:Uncharacterized protein n=1 Tax=Lactuca saligna TaxID=75948 RepID=A0AA35YC71_LACSI|nr:unnamed protein product [Lactuca saligna]